MSLRDVATALGYCFVELVRLSLVLAAAAIGPALFGHELVREPGGAAALLVVNLAIVALFAVYALFAIVPARDLVEGWLGILARRVPPRFDDAPENLGRAACALLFSTAWIALLFRVTVRHGHRRTEDALMFAFVLLAMVVFGLGTAVPRLYFARHRAPAGDGKDAPPELLRIAGRRGAAFFFCAFLGIGLGFAGANFGAALRRPRPAHEAVAPVAPVAGAAAGEWFSRFTQGALCRVPASDCPAQATRRLMAGVDGTAHLELFRTEEGTLCRLDPDGTWPAATPWTPALERVLDGASDAWSAKAVLPVRAGERLGFRLSLPTGAERCTYALEIDQEAQPATGGGR